MIRVWLLVAVTAARGLTAIDLHGWMSLRSEMHDDIHSGHELWIMREGQNTKLNASFGVALDILDT